MQNPRIAKIKWQARRGMLELDLILSEFISTAVSDLSEPELTSFEELLSYSDPVLYSLLMGHSEAESKGIDELVKLIRSKP